MIQRPGRLNEDSQELVRKTMFSISSAAQRLSRIFEGLSLRSFLKRRGKSTGLSLHELCWVHSLMQSSTNVYSSYCKLASCGISCVYVSVLYHITSVLLKQISQPEKAELLYTWRPARFFTLGGGETDLISSFYYCIKYYCYCNITGL